MSRSAYLATLIPLAASLALAQPAKDPHAAAKKLMEEARCEACHAKKVGGDGTSLYRREARIVKSRSQIAAQVSRCNTELNLGLFPEDEAAIAAYLNAAYYRYD